MGQEMEPKAFALWNRLHKGQYIATRSGLLLDRVYPEVFGATPDGLVFDYHTKDLIGTLELKFRAQAKLCSTKSEIPQKYMMQMLGQLCCLSVNRWFYLEIDPNGRHFEAEGEFTEEQKQELREDLMRYKSLVEAHTKETFPKRCTKYREIY